jgi:hypothetical protein
MAKTDLLKEAIADAKAVRETALANAKIALEEAFTPRLQSMLSAKLAEDEEMEEAEDAVETNGDGMDAAAGAPVDEDMEGEDMEEDMAPEMETPVAEPAPEMEEADHGEEMEEDLELEAIIKELEDEVNEAEEDLEEVSDSTDIGKGDNKMDQVSSSDQDDPGKGKLSETEEDKVDEAEKDDMDEDVSIDEIISALKEDDDKEDVKETEEKDDVKEAKDKEDLEEAYNVIRFLKSKINEVNLLNAKLLFSNKLFRNHSLNEGQKMKVIENFDRAQSLREVKLVFATLSESFNFGGKTKRTIKESYASKSTRSTAPKKVISEGSDLSARWRKLANL